MCDPHVKSIVHSGGCVRARFTRRCSQWIMCELCEYIHQKLTFSYTVPISCFAQSLRVITAQLDWIPHLNTNIDRLTLLWVIGCHDIVGIESLDQLVLE